MKPAQQQTPSMPATLSFAPQRRPMTARDLDAVMSVETTAYSHPWSRGNFIDSLAAHYVADVLHSAADGLLGYFVAMAGVDELHLLNLTIAPDHQGRGLGSSLLRAVQGHAQALGAQTLWLEVRESNQRARALYRRRGFVEVGLRKGYYPAAARREDAIVMRLQVAPGGGASSLAASPAD